MLAGCGLMPTREWNEEKTMWRIWVLLALPVVLGWLIWRVRRVRRLRDANVQEQKQAERLNRDEGDDE
jgi:predicted negative regulator of RcsB-dependent stress response